MKNLNTNKAKKIIIKFLEDQLNAQALKLIEIDTEINDLPNHIKVNFKNGKLEHNIDGYKTKLFSLNMKKTNAVAEYELTLARLINFSSRDGDLNYI